MDITQPATARFAGLATFASRKAVWLALAAILIVAAVLRLHALGAASIWLDESTTWDQARRDFIAMLQSMAYDVHPPLYNSILHFFIRAFGDRETVLRLPSAISGVAAVAAIFWVGSLLDGRAAGLLAAVLLCLSGFHIDYSQEARSYALLSLTAILFAGTTIQALETNRLGWHAVSSLAALLLIYTHIYGSLLWLAVAIAVVANAWARRDPGGKVLLRWAAGQTIALLLFLPWAIVLTPEYEWIRAHGFWIQRPDAEFMLELCENLASGTAMAVALLVSTMLAVAPRRWLGAAHGSTIGNHQALRRAILVAWLIGPLLFGLAHSLISEPMLLDRYVICSLPAWLILAAVGVCRLYRIWGALVLALAIAGTIANWWSYEPEHDEDARATVKAYTDRALPAECVLLYRAFTDSEILYYLHKPPRCFIGAARLADIKPWQLASPRVWLFFGFIDEGDRSALADSLRAHGWQMIEVRHEMNLSLELIEPAKP